MKNKKHRVLNGELILAELISMLLTHMFAFAALDKSSTNEDKLIFWSLTAIGVVSIVLCFVFMRHYHEFDSDGIWVWYFGGKYQYIKWKNIKQIDIYTCNPGRRGGALILFQLIFFIYRKYRIEGKNQNNLKIDRDFIVSKSFRTTKYINLYWNGIIRGTFYEKATKKSLINDLDSVSVRKIEKSVMLSSEKIIEEYRDRFSQLGLEVRRTYSYYYEDCSGETLVRPITDYSYDVEITIHKVHKSHNENISFTVELMEGRVGKTEFLGHIVDDYENTLREELDFYLKEITRDGFEQCYKNENTTLAEHGILNYKTAKLLVGVSFLLLILAFVILLVG